VESLPASGVLDDRAAALGFRPAPRTTGPLGELTGDVVTDLIASPRH
jgi:hypothetical protein